MKIINNSNGKCYHLLPDSVLDCERTNPFFNEQGEQTLPLSIPDTELNKSLIGFPEKLANISKPSQQILCTIEDEDYHMPCRQVILSATRKKGISTSFYMNEGLFYSKLSDIYVSEIFGNETIPGITTVSQAIDFCRSLVNGSNPNFAIFPVVIDSNESTPALSFDTLSATYSYINRYGATFQITSTETQWRDDLYNGSGDFYNSVDRKETINDKTINVPAGFYISPFIRANYLLKRVFSYLGYTLNDNFFTRTSPFTNMVFVNQVIDTIVNGTIKLCDLVPTMTLSDFLDVFRKRFNCEFIPNEVDKTMDIVLFNDVINENPSINLDPYVTSDITIEYPEAYKQVVLKCSDKISNGDSPESFDTLQELIDKYPAAYLDETDGFFYCDGYKGITKVHKKVGSSSMDFYIGGSMDTQEISSTDSGPEMRALDRTTEGPEMNPYKRLYIGGGISLHSKISYSDSSSDSSDKQQKAILAFFWSISGYPYGTISNVFIDATEAYTKTTLFDYTLTWNGANGLFEKFYRSLDSLYRNSLHVVKADLLLPNFVKRTLPSHKLVLLNNQKLLINNLKYNIGGKKSTKESEFKTVKLYEPISQAKTFEELFPPLSTSYAWKAKSSYEVVTKSQYDASIYKDASIITIYPEPASSSLLDGNHHYEQHTCIQTTDDSNNTIYKLYTYWLEVLAK